VCDEKDCRVDSCLNLEELVLQFLASDRIKCTERFVHQDDIGVCGECASDADPLLLAAGECSGILVTVRRRWEVHQLKQFVDTVVDM